MMYAVIQTGGKQYRVAQGDRLRVEKIEATTDSIIELDKVLMVAADETTKVGVPYVEGGKVTAVVKEHGRAKKVRIIKFRRRKHHMKRQGHRQAYTLLEVTGISATGMNFITETAIDTTASTPEAANVVTEE